MKNLIFLLFLIPVLLQAQTPSLVITTLSGGLNPSFTSLMITDTANIRVIRFNDGTFASSAADVDDDTSKAGKGDANVFRANNTFRGQLTIGNTANNILLDSINGLHLTGKATQWEDLFFPFTTGNAGGNPYPVFSDTSMAWNFVVDTVGVTKCIQYFCIQFPHSTVFDTIHPHVHYKHTTAQGTPTFVFKYKWFNITGSTGGAWNWIRMGTGIDGTTNYTHQIVTNASNLGILATGKTLSSILVCQVYLLTTSGATKTCDAYQMDVHFKKQSLGSKTEYSD